MLESIRRRINETFIGEIRRLARLYEETRRELEEQGVKRRSAFILAFFKRIIDDYRESAINRIRDRIRSYLAFYDLLRASLPLFRDRAKILFEVERRHFYHRDKTIVRIRDQMLAELPEETRNRIIDALRQATLGKHVPTQVLMEEPLLRWFLQRYMLYYQRYPCKHSSFAIKVTPVTIHFFKGWNTTYYVMRFIRVKDLKHDPYLEVARPVDLYFTMQVRKPYWDILNTFTYAESGTMDSSDYVTIARDDKRQSFIRIPLRRAILQPHHIKRGFAKAVGEPELTDSASHCSIYAILQRRPRTSRYYSAGLRRDMIAKRKLRAVRDVTWSLGLRG
ncbi:MAG: hypothetical protein DRH17_12915 [Deltaproteobacteria bacterium]|nr:MAG: hypothetical protein DRH17_12915 [Deltaproteobacteria bacterium]